jgi:DNA-binding CsgD family transcriptional regulator
MALTRAALAEVDFDADPLRAARLLERRGKLMRTLGKSDGLSLLRQAYELTHRVEDQVGRATLLAEIASALASVDAEESWRVAEEAIASARTLGDVALEVSATVTMGKVCGDQMSAEEGLAETLKAAGRAEETDDSTGLVRALVNISHQLFALGRYAESVDAATRGQAVARRVGISRTTGAYLLTNGAEALVALGRWDEADALFTESIRLDPPGVLAVPAILLQARLRLVRADPAADVLVNRALGFQTKAYLESQIRLPLHELRITSALAGGDTEGALSAAAVALADPDASRDRRYGWPLLAAAARAAFGATSSATPDAGLTGRVSEVAAALLPARYPAEFAYAAEIVALREGDLESWRAAVAAWRVDGQTHPLAEALLRLAEAAAAAGDRGAAAEAIAEAGGIAGELDAAALRREVELLARRLGLRSAGHQHGGATGAGLGGAEPLTAREAEVLRLVAEGHSNRQIAEALYISPKTASVHVSRIIAKLSVANRVEAAAVAHRLGLLG